MGLGVLLFPALGGYLFLLLWNWTRHDFLLWPGYHVVFRSAAAGLLLFAASFTLTVVFDLQSLESVCALIALTPIDSEFVDAVVAAAMSVALGVGVPPILNRFHSRETAARLTAERFGRRREVFIQDSILTDGLVEISTRSGKCYVAAAQQIEMALPGDSDVAVTPLLSGYREPETRRFRITSNYGPLLRHSRGAGQLLDLRIAIPLSEIVSVRPFDIELYVQFFDPDSGSPRNSPR